MPRLFVVFRTFDRIWACKTFTRELAPFEMDISEGPIKFMFMVDQITAASNGKEMFVVDSHLIGQNNIKPVDPVSFYCHAHKKFSPVIVRQCKQELATLSPTTGVRKGLMRRFSVPSLELDLNMKSAPDQCSSQDVVYFVLPKFRCTILMDAHLASCVYSEYSRSKVFRRHFMHYIWRNNGFRNCVPDYEKWTQEERDAWENYLSVPYMIDLVAVWPKQKIDYAWSRRILGLVNKHVVLEEGFAWLSTLGGAHSSLGETFIHHAEQAGKISGQQLRLAIELGNESLIARCYIFWAWSLLQRGLLRRCKHCVLNTWKFCQTLRTRDTILENMCKAVWCRLKYKRSQLRAKRRQYTKNNSSLSLDKDNEDGGGDRSSSSISSHVVPQCSNIVGSSSGDVNSKSGSPSCLETAVKTHSVVSNSVCVR
ncbi:unnamed protein product [Candidula unifasciata]|uniref:Uncharacterized protein n=1 Tax=Candidula unifasciata TaxID=100452 RepID=A0A8S3ZUT9_9EUPU|nr:unnamed protein product [Candidula unifasciata]